MINNSFLFVRSPNWLPVRPGLRHTLPSDACSWIFEQHSLTKRLRVFYGDRVAVRILYHQWKPAFFNECQALHLPHQQYNLVREVLLHADGQPLLLARTILPEKTIKIAKRNLSHLGIRPLGEVIFSYPDLQRRQLAVCKLNPDDWSRQLRQQITVAQPAWARRTVYAIKHQPMLVSEFFLPGALQA